jgi:hypothetical protein
MVVNCGCIIIWRLIVLASCLLFLFVLDFYLCLPCFVHEYLSSVLIISLGLLWYRLWCLCDCALFRNARLIYLLLLLWLSRVYLGKIVSRVFVHGVKCLGYVYVICV